MRSWRQVCEEALRARSEADAIRAWDCSRGTGEGPRAPFNYRFEHTLAVVKAARWLCPLCGADAEIVECAAWLHDARKVMKQGRGGDTHAAEASAAVEGILAGTDFPAAKIPAVRHAIERHVGLRLAAPLEPLETAALWDCDKLSKIGAASLVHFACIAGAFQPVTTAGILHRGESWLDLAEGIAASMNTAPARQEAERRLAFLKEHYAQLRREWRDPMEGRPG
jgi:uncharacterized protein